MSAQTNPVPKTTTQNGKSPGAISAPTQPSMPAPVMKAEDEAPTFETIRDYLRGREVTLVSPPSTSFTTAYCSPRKDTDAGTFNCKILDVIIDSKGTPVSALVEYREKGSRVYGSRDLITLDNVYISSQFKLAAVSDVVEDAIAAEASTKH